MEIIERGDASKMWPREYRTPCCESLLKIEPEDIKHNIDYGGDHSWYIDCPVCGDQPDVPDEMHYSGERWLKQQEGQRSMHLRSAEEDAPITPYEPPVPPEQQHFTSSVPIVCYCGHTWSYHDNTMNLKPPQTLSGVDHGCRASSCSCSRYAPVGVETFS